MNITIKMFSGLMAYLPPGAEGNTAELSVAATTTPHDLVTRYKVPRNEIRVVMVNGCFAPPEQRDAPLADGDVVTLWPTLQGG